LSEQLQLRRGTSSQVAAFTGQQGETVVDTTNNRLVLNDGATTGSWAAAKLAEVITNTRTAVSDAAYTALTTDRLIAYTSLTASRVVSLPTSASFPAGTRLLVIDESGSCSATKTITVTSNGTDTIEGANSSAVLALAYGFIGLESNGAGGWFLTDQLALASAPNGANIQAFVAETLLSGMSGASVTATNFIPANCIVLAVGARITTTITGATSFEVGVSGNLGQFGSGIGLTAGTTNFGLVGPTAFYSATSVIVTAAGPNFTAGAVRLSVHYLLANPSTS
jgi:hypothetical protein